MSSGSGSESLALRPSLPIDSSSLATTHHTATAPTPTSTSTATAKDSPDTQRRKQPTRWTPEEDDFLRQAYSRDKCWGEIAKSLHLASEGRYERSAEQCSQRWSRVIDPRIRKGAWTAAEDQLLHDAVVRCGINSWAKVAQYIVGRTDIQCRTRWLQSKQRETNVNRLRADQSLHPMHHMQCVDFEYRPDLVRKKKRTSKGKSSSSTLAHNAATTTTTTTTTEEDEEDDDNDDDKDCDESPHKLSLRPSCPNTLHDRHNHHKPHPSAPPPEPFLAPIFAADSSCAPFPSRSSSSSSSLSLSFPSPIAATHSALWPGIPIDRTLLPDKPPQDKPPPHITTANIPSAHDLHDHAKDDPNDQHASPTPQSQSQSQSLSRFSLRFILN